MEYSFSLNYSSYVNEFSKVTGYKINIWKSLAFLFTNNKKSERELKKTISFTIATKIIKYLGINLPKAWVFIGRPDAKAETPILWPTHEKS